MDFFAWLEKHIHPPGIRKKNRRTIYTSIARAHEKLIADSSSVFRDHFPALCSADRLAEHGEARKIPRFNFDTDETYRERLANGSSILDETGEHGLFVSIMDQMFPDRWKFVDYPEEGFTIGYSRIGRTRIGGDSRLIVYIKDMTEEDLDNTNEFLDWFLGADIEIIIIAWQYVPYPPVTIEELRQNGGANWLKEQFEDIAPILCEVMPDDSFTIGRSQIGSHRIWDQSEIILLYVPRGMTVLINQRLAVVLNDAIPRKVIEI